MGQVALEGREVKVTTRLHDGLIGCSWVILIFDRGSSKVVGHTVSNSENAEAVAEAITTVCEAQGLRVMLLTDNGEAITSRKIAGGLHPRYRTTHQRAADWVASFERLSQGRIVRHVSPRQRRSVKMAQHKRMVMPDGRVKNAVRQKQSVAPKVVQRDARGPFSPAAALHPMHNCTGKAVAESHADTPARAGFLKSLLGIQGLSREASRGNR